MKVKPFTGEREATIQFNDVFGKLPIEAVNKSTANIVDFDAALTAQVRNTNHFKDEHFPIDSFPALGDYGVVLVDQLRQDQLDESDSLWDDPSQQEPDRHAEYKVLEESLRKTIVAIVNCAPRRSDHHEQGVNGDNFYAGVTKSGVEVYGQLAYFRGLVARSRLVELYKIPDDAGVWPVGEQFRSSVVSQARRDISLLEQVPLTEVPKLEGDGHLAYIDKFGNVRLEMTDSEDVTSKLVVGDKVHLKLERRGAENGQTGFLPGILVVSRLTEIPEGELGIYINPADPIVEKGPRYVELARRVSDPNGHADHAYNSLYKAVLPISTNKPLTSAMWNDVDIKIIAD